jgi:hypothetical protein
MPRCRYLQQEHGRLSPTNFLNMLKKTGMRGKLYKVNCSRCCQVVGFAVSKVK